MAEPDTQPLISKGRLETLSDGVFAIVMTLLVLQLVTPIVSNAQTGEALNAALLALWPKFLSYSISFLVISVYWVSHHMYFQFVRGTNEVQLWTNLIFLFFLSLIPFSADLIGGHPGFRAAGIIYGLNLTAACSALLFNWWYASRRGRLVHTGLDPEVNKRIFRRGWFAVVGFLSATAVAAVSPEIAFWLYLLMGILGLVSQLQLNAAQHLPHPK